MIDSLNGCVSLFAWQLESIACTSFDEAAVQRGVIISEGENGSDAFVRLECEPAERAKLVWAHFGLGWVGRTG